MHFASRLRRFFVGGGTPASNPAVQLEPLEGRQLMSAAAPPIVIDPVPPIPVGVVINAEANESYHGPVGKVDNADGAGGFGKTLKNDQAVVDWGDGSTSIGSLALSKAGEVVVGGTHTYAKKGDYAVNVIVETHPPTGFFPVLLARIASSAHVTSDAEGGVTLTEVATQKFTARLGSFDFANVDLALTATITWGDGTTSTGVIQRTSFDDYNVIGTHTYKNAAVYKVHVGVFGRPIGSGPLPQFVAALASFDSTIDVKGFAATSAQTAR